MKKCTKCNIEKELSYFYKSKNNKDGYRTRCIPCYREIDNENCRKRLKKYQSSTEYLEKQEQKYRMKPIFEKRRIERNRLNSKNYYTLNKERIAEKRAEKRFLNIEEEREKERIYRRKNKDKINKLKREYYQKNKEKISKIKRERNKERYSEDTDYKIKINLRSRLNKAIKNSQKTGSAVNDLGCSIEELKKHLESQFQPGMTWDNWSRDGWHIDHIVPLSSFDLTDRQQLLKACHYTNLQPLWAEDNLGKNKY